MDSRWRNRIAAACLAGVLLASPLLSGCVQVQVTAEVPDSATPTPYTELESPREARDLAILGIEFNPPLRAEEVVAAGRLAMLVAVENRGMAEETQVVVEASLAGIGETDAIAKRSEVLKSIAPGEVRLVRFESLSLFPYRSAYVMTVSVAPLPGETRTADNLRSYRLSLTVPSTTPVPVITAP